MKRGGWLKRNKPLQRGEPMQRSRMNSVNPERKAKRFAKDFGPLAEFVWDKGCYCCVTGEQQTPTQACHVRSRGAGNHAWNDDGTGNLIPMCHKHHTFQHAHGWGDLARLMVPEDSLTTASVTSQNREWADGLAKDIGNEFLASGGERY